MDTSSHKTKHNLFNNNISGIENINTPNKIFNMSTSTNKLSLSN